MVISSIYTLANQNLSVALNTSTVDIKLDTFTLSESGKVEYKDDAVLFPGDIAPFIPVVTNLGESCYLRVKVKYINDDLDFMDYITNFPENFEKYGDYYYYKTPINKNESIVLFDSIKIPENILSLTTSKTLNINILAEVVQDKNFMPDYTTDIPWKTVVPTVNLNNTYNVQISDSSEIRIKYGNNSETDITVPNDFLKNAKKALPGDSFIENVKIKNNSNGKARYYFRVEADSNEVDVQKYLREIKLKIENSKGNTLYNGAFLSGNSILLANLDKKEQEDITIYVSIPTELSNEYTNLNSSFSVLFSANYENNEGKTITEENTSAEKGLISLITNPKTGDKIDVVLLIFLLSSVGLVITMLLDYNERKKLINK